MASNEIFSIVIPTLNRIYESYYISREIYFCFVVLGMTHAKFKERLDFLMDFLDLPSKTRALINMSGGQQRRHSALKSEK